MIGSGKIPVIAELTEKYFFKPMNSVQPPLSSTAWASFLTGKYPDQHGLLSFTERDPHTMEWYTPDARHLRSKTILDKLSQAGKRVFSMNVPVTFPPKKINGISICGFLGSDISKGVYPESEAIILEQKEYVIDANTELAKTNFRQFINHLWQVLEKRIEIMWHYFEKENWDFFMCHIMETDRLHHFTWEFMEQGIPEVVILYEKFYKRLDDLIGQIMKNIDNNFEFIILSDHGFETLKKEVNLNRFLWEKELLHFTKPVPKSLQDMHPKSVAYSLYPGRIFINLKGREKNGSVSPGHEYEIIRNKIRHLLLEIKHGNDKVVKDVLNAENIYPGYQNFQNSLPDLLAIPTEGFDLKGVLWSKKIFDKTVFNGKHTFDNAFVLASKNYFKRDDIDITDIYDVILKMMSFPD